MKLNFWERLYIVNPLRPLIQRHLEARQLLAMGGALGGGQVLEIGCGPGGGIDLIYNVFNADELHAFDLDSRMMAHVRRRVGRKRPNTSFWTGNVRHIPVADDRYDAVFNFGVIHHVVNWRAALPEILRVLKPGARFYCEEILKRYITHPFWGRLMHHPQEDRFDSKTFTQALRQSGFEIRAVRELGDLFLWVIADKPG